LPLNWDTDVEVTELTVHFVALIGYAGLVVTVIESLINELDREFAKEIVGVCIEAVAFGGIDAKTTSLTFDPVSTVATFGTFSNAFFAPSESDASYRTLSGSCSSKESCMGRAILAELSADRFSVLKQALMTPPLESIDSRILGSKDICHSSGSKPCIVVGGWDRGGTR